jgi:hypothetical protein
MDALLNIILVGFLSYLLYFLLNKIKQIGDGTNNPFGNADAAIFALALALTQITYFIIYLPLTMKILYEEDEKLSIRPLPIPLKTLQLSKLTGLYIKSLTDFGLMEFGFFVAFFFVRQESLLFLVLALFAVILSAALLLFFDVLFSYPFKRVSDRLNENTVVLLVVSILISVGIGTLYFYLLIGIINIISSQNINNVFSVESLKVFTSLATYLFPVDGFISLVLLRGNPFIIILSILIPLLSIPGSLFISKTYAKMNFKNGDKSSKGVIISAEKQELKPVKHPLLFKELRRIIRSSKKTFSYFALLILVPMFSFYSAFLINQVFILFGLNTVRSAQSLIDSGASPLLATFISFIPSYRVPLIIFLVTLFTSLIYSPGDEVLSGEENALGTLLTLPLSFHQQLVLKFKEGIFFSGLTSLITSLILLISSIFNPVAALFFFLLNSLFTWSGYLFSEAQGIKNLGLSKESSLGLIYIFLGSLFLLLFSLLLINALPASLTPPFSQLIVGSLLTLTSIGLLSVSFLSIKKASLQAVNYLGKNGGRELA